jgi:hypothetical protein
MNLNLKFKIKKGLLIPSMIGMKIKTCLDNFIFSVGNPIFLFHNFNTATNLKITFTNVLKCFEIFGEKKLSREVPIFMPIMEGDKQPLLIFNFLKLKFLKFLNPLLTFFCRNLRSRSINK